MFGEIPSVCSCRSLKRRGPASNASTISRAQRSPTAVSASARGEGSSRGTRGIVVRKWVILTLLGCRLQSASYTEGAALSTITDLQADIQRVAGRVGPAVVGFGRGWGRGSGVVVARDRVITCAHNLRGERVHVSFDDGRRTEGQLTGTAAALDLAVVAVDTAEIEPLEWDPAAAGDVALGTAIVALGNPGGRGLRATPGFVASAGRSFRGPRGRRIENC